MTEPPIGRALELPVTTPAFPSALLDATVWRTAVDAGLQSPLISTQLSHLLRLKFLNDAVKPTCQQLSPFAQAGVSSLG